MYFQMANFSLTDGNWDKMYLIPLSYKPLLKLISSIVLDVNKPRNGSQTEHLWYSILKLGPFDDFNQYQDPFH